MNSSILKVLILTLALILAVVMGNLLATDVFTAFLWIAWTSIIAISIYLERRIWLLIPFLGAIELSLRVPGQPSTLLVAQEWVLSFSLILFLMRRLPYRPRFTEMEFWFLVLFCCVLQTFIRNPVGLNIFGGGTVGGRPYALFVNDLLTAILLAGLTVAPKDLKLMIRLSIIGGLINLGVSILGTIYPRLGVWTGAASMKQAQPNLEDVGQTYDAGQATRIGYLGTFGRNASLWLSSFISPLKACVHPLWALLLIVTVVAAAMSGFRNAIATVALTYLVGLAYRGGVVSMIISGFAGVLLLIGLSVGNMIVPYPPNIQRAFSFLPGAWEKRYVEDAEGSSEWRFEIWKEALTSDRYIRNKWFGDGLGFSASDLERALALQATKGNSMGISGFDAHRESILLSGDYHSGPVQTIRVIGYVGLLLLLIAQVRLAVHAHRQIIRCRNSEWFPVALFIGIPLIWNPVFFVFIFGDFKGAATTLLLGGAMVRLLENNLPLPAYGKTSRLPVLLPRNREARLTARAPLAGR
jgi:hypothetical protein